MIHFYYGDDTYSISEKLRHLRRDFSAKHGQTSVEEYALNKAETDLGIKSRLRDLILSQGLFAEQKLIILRDFLADINKYPQTQEFLIETLNNFPSGIDVVFVQSDDFDGRLKFFKFLQKTAKSEEFPIPKLAALEKWIANYLKRFDFTIEKTALAEFVKLLGDPEKLSYDLWQVASELEKLMLYVTPLTKGESQGTIGLAAVRQIVRRNLSVDVFTLT